MNGGWFPSDEGSLGQSAERVLYGEIPHLDFHDVYTGGLSYLHAGIFYLTGPNLFALRVSLFLFFLAWIPAVYAIAKRFASPLTAGALVLLAVAWSVPSYFAAIASWFNLFFATFGLVALLRFIDTGHRRWAFVAGVCAGLSILAKMVGLYQVAAGLLFFAFREQVTAKATARSTNGYVQRNGYTVLLVAASLLLLGIVFALLRGRESFRDIIHFFLPVASLVVSLVWGERTVARAGLRERLSVLLYAAIPFLIGVLAPLAVFLLPYLLNGGVPGLIEGLFVRPTQRFTYATLPPPNALFSLIGGLALIVFLLHPRWKDPRGSEKIVLIAVMAAVLSSVRYVKLTYLGVWYVVSGLVPAMALAGGYMLLKDRSIPILRRQQLFLILQTVVMFNLIRFPFASAAYFVYTAPLVVLALAAIVSSSDRATNFAPASALSFFLAFAVLAINPADDELLGDHFRPRPRLEVLTLERAGGLRIEATERDQYERLVAEIEKRAQGEYIYCTPDCPEVYFISGYRNPTPTLYDFFDEPSGRTQRLLDVIQQHQLHVAVVNRGLTFSPAIPDDLDAALARLFTNETRIGNFIVRWR
jgi:hypothetical protein